MDGDAYSCVGSNLESKPPPRVKDKGTTEGMYLLCGDSHWIIEPRCTDMMEEPVFPEPKFIEPIAYVNLSTPGKYYLKSISRILCAQVCDV